MADIKQLPRGGRHGYFISKEEGLRLVHYLCNKPLSSIENLFIHCRCLFDPLSLPFGPTVVAFWTHRRCLFDPLSLPFWPTVVAFLTHRRCLFDPLSLSFWPTVVVFLTHRHCLFDPLSLRPALVLLSGFQFIFDISVPRLQPVSTHFATTRWAKIEACYRDRQSRGTAQGKQACTNLSGTQCCLSHVYWEILCTQQ